MPRYSNYLLAALALAGLVLLLLPRNKPIIGPVVEFNPYTTIHSSPAVSVPKAWIKIDTGLGFTFYAPPGTKYRLLQGIDTSAEEAAGPNFKLIFDLGATAFGVREISNSRDSVLIDNRSAEIVVADDVDLQETMQVGYRHFVGLEMPSAICRYRTFGLPCQWDRLAVEGAARAPDDTETIKNIYKSIRFSVASRK